ncbi:MAG: hypothetical protein J6332_02975 [Abditibacteriota bacterium]|nr:hypothetical protein [Abditibacteriota bacterium]
MKKAFTFILILVLALGVAASAVQYSQEVKAGWNFIAFPGYPANTAVTSTFANFDFDFDCILQTMVGSESTAFDPFDEFYGLTNVFLGQGYYFYTPEDGTISYEGVADGIPDANGRMTDMWFELPKAGWQMIGNPFDHDVYVNADQSDFGTGDHIFFTDGNVLKTWSEAVEADWVASIMINNESAGDVGYFSNTSWKLEPGLGYYFQTYRDNLVMIIPAY